jgi:hypothetical protein
MAKKLQGLLFSFFLMSCGVDFDTCLPNDQPAIKNFPPELIGNYEFSDSTFGEKPEDLFLNRAYYYKTLYANDSLKLISGHLVISKKNVTFHFNSEIYYDISKFDTIGLVDRYRNGRRYVKGKYIVFTDSMEPATIVNLGFKDKLISFNGKYYFNHLVAKKDWAIYQFERIKDSFYSMNITNERDRNLLTDTNQVWKDISPVVHLSNLQFKNFVEQGGFRGRFGFKKSH